jgi:hypothetical protein
MTIDTALFAAGSIGVVVLVWQLHRLTSQWLREIQHDLDSLRELACGQFVIGLDRTAEEMAASGTDPVLDQGHPASSKGTPTLAADLEPELTQVDLLCDKLITLAPPKTALPLLTKSESRMRPLRENREVRRDGQERLRAWPQR